MRSFILVLLSFISCGLSADVEVDFDRQEIQDRIKPVGKVRIQEQMNTQSEVKPPVEQPVEQKEVGQATYEQFCVVCHKDGVAGSPKFRDSADWKPRLAGKSIDDLVASANKGLNAMPPKGSCADCTDSDMKAAIQYMLPK